MSFTDSALADKLADIFQSKIRGKYSYVDLIDKMPARNARNIIVDYDDIIFDDDITDTMYASPDRVLAAMSRAVKEVLQLRFPAYAEKIRQDLRVRLMNYPVERSLRTINSETIGRIVCVSGMVVRTSEVKPLAKELTFRCEDGHPTLIIIGNKMSVKEPLVCADKNCKNKEFEVIPEESRFIDYQLARLQELPEDLPPGQLPHYLDVVLKNDLVNNARPGDRIVLTGIVRIEQEVMPGTPRNQSPLYRLRIDGNNIEYLGGHGQKTSRKIERESISKKDIEKIKKLSEDPDIYNMLIRSFAPHIHGHEIIKESILLLLAGSIQKERDDGSKVRGDINVFLVGDPGTAKSEMLKFCSRIAPRGLYTSGRGSTAAGLTAAVVKDKSGMLMLEAGAVVLGDQGMVSIDEFDKMKDEDRSALHEVMEQQTASIAKGGIVATLNARTSILAAANPIYGKYDTYKNITENIKMPIPLLTRFDLIFIIRDIPTAKRDDLIADRIIENHATVIDSTKAPVESEFLTKYLTYAKKLNPKITQEAKDAVKEYYLKMRNIEDAEMLTVTPRQLEGIIRLATARARVMLRSTVTKEDAERAIFLIETMLKDAGIDVNTGEVDPGVLQGKPKSEISRMHMFFDILKSMGPDPVTEADLSAELEKTGKFGMGEIDIFIQKMCKEGIIYEAKPGCWSKA